ncbi:MAG: FG-GAP repeat domain-containing protein, partial [Myxococcota bacterium]
MPSASIPDACSPTVTHCEQSEELGIEDEPAYGRGVALVDIDGDGWLDIWRSDSGSPVDGHVMRAGAYRNRGDGTFEPWDLGIAEEDVIMNWAGVFGDIDNDGDLDLFLVNGGYEGDRPCALYRNDLAETGAFTEITEAAGIDTDSLPWWGAAFSDFDGDGDLDLVITARTELGGTTSVDTLRLYRNDGAGSFEEVSNELGLPDPQGDVKNPTWVDYDRDGDQDLVIGRVLPNIVADEAVGLFENRGRDGFEHVDSSIFPGESIASEDFAFAVAAADFDQDGWQDIYLGRWFGEDLIALNQGDGTFELV